MVSEDEENEILNLWDNYSKDPEIISKISGINLEDILSVLSKYGRSTETSGGHTKRISYSHRLPPLWKLDLLNFLRKNFGVPFITACMSFESGALSLAEFDNLKNDLLFSYKDIMDAIDLDYNNKNEYAKVTQFFMEQRKHFEDVIDYFASNGTFDKWNTDGYTPQEMFVQCVLEMMHRDTYPFYADLNDNFKLKPLELEDYLKLVRARAIKISKEVEYKSNSLKKIDSYIPILDKMIRTPLNDGTMFELPIICPICGIEFSNSTSFAQHLRESHSTES